MPQSRPLDIEYGWVRQIHYLPDFGRYEASVVLHMQDDSQAELITSVAPRVNETPEGLSQRLVLDAARLLRLFESGLNVRELAPAA